MTTFWSEPTHFYSLLCTWSTIVGPMELQISEDRTIIGFLEVNESYRFLQFMSKPEIGTAGLAIVSLAGHSPPIVRQAT
jgi:hypothetical protein